jgi:hypothetical protein
MNLTCIFSYGIEDKTFVMCRENWAFYLSHVNLPFKVNSLFFKTAPTADYNEILFDGHDYIVGFNNSQLSTNENSSYSTTNCWSVDEHRRSNDKFKRMISFSLEQHPETDYLIYINITAFLSLEGLLGLLSVFPLNKVYAGWPLYFRPEKFFYLSGSGIVLSRDVAVTLRDRYQAYNGSESSDIVWGRLIGDTPRIVLSQFGQITLEDLGELNFKGRLQCIDRLIDKGVILYRFKNNKDLKPRSLIDPQLQLYVMTQSLAGAFDNQSKIIDMQKVATEMALRGDKIVVIG